MRLGVDLKTDINKTCIEEIEVHVQNLTNSRLTNWGPMRII